MWDRRQFLNLMAGAAARSAFGAPAKKAQFPGHPRRRHGLFRRPLLWR